MWGKGDIQELLKEGKTIQRQLQGTRSLKDDRDALRCLSNREQTGLFSLDQIITKDATSSSTKTVREILESKHPDANPPYVDAILSMLNEDSPSNDFHPILFDSITEDDIRASALHTEGVASPSGLDVMNWRRLFTAFGQSSNDLCNALASFARIGTNYVDQSGLMAYTA